MRHSQRKGAVANWRHILACTPHRRTRTSPFVRRAFATITLLFGTTNPALAQPTPSARNSHVLTAGPNGSVLLVGGASTSAPRLADTLWSWSGTSWRAVTDAGPRARNLPAAAFDSRRNLVVLYGGNGLGTGTRFGDT